MQEEETNDNDLEGRLRDYFRAEDVELETPLDLWDSISPRLGEQRRPGWMGRLLPVLRPGRPWSTASISIPFWAPEARKALAVSMVLAIAVGMTYFGVSLATGGREPMANGESASATTATDRAVPYVEQGEEEHVDDHDHEETTTGEGETTETDTPVVAGPVAIAIGAVGDALSFDVTSLSAGSGDEVTVTFNNPSAVNSHNFVVVQDGTKDAVATDGTVAGPDNDWVPPGDPRVIANTVLIGPGESTEVTFTAPASGTYQFVCTFPGHNFTMFGEFIVN
ncbi:MAG: hypothetical protein IH963_15825 [Chloroflexi bacterium]|nr:hypothetical protein [Chloroflexota bacterium]